MYTASTPSSARKRVVRAVRARDSVLARVRLGARAVAAGDRDNLDAICETGALEHEAVDVRR
jgi:hypothetical protein